MLSMDLKVISRSHLGHKYILCIIDEVTNYLITVPIFQAKSEEIVEALIENVITKYCIPEYIIMDQDSAFMSSLMTYLFHRFDIKIKTVAHYNHQSLQAEHGIKSLSCILTKHLTNLGQMWPKYLSLATFAYNTFNIPNLGNYCYVRQCSLMLKIVLYFFKCLGFHMQFISLYVALSLHNCSSSGLLVFACLGRISLDHTLNNNSTDSYIIYRGIYSS